MQQMARRAPISCTNWPTNHTEIRAEGQLNDRHMATTQQSTHLIMREAHTLVSYKAAKERHWDEAEEDDEEDRPTDDSLRLWAAKRGDQD